MRNDVSGLRTWWLAGFALWALAVWGAALFGLGGRMESGGGAGDAPALPVVPATAMADMASADNAEALARPLFAADRRPHPFVLEENRRDDAGAIRLTGVLMTSGFEMATVTTEQGHSLRLRLGGEPQAGWRLVSLQPRSAVVEGPPGRMELELRVFSGAGAVAGAVQGNPAMGGQEPALPGPPAPVPAAPVPPPPQAEAISTDTQIRAIRARIEARRRQLQQQNPAVQPANQNP